jgi:hypothetical protein
MRIRIQCGSWYIVQFSILKQGTGTVYEKSSILGTFKYCESEFIFFGFRYFLPLSDSHSRTNILTRLFYKFFIAFICIPELLKQKKSFAIEKTYMWSLSSQVLNLWFFGIIFILFYSSTGIWIRIRPKPSDSDPQHSLEVQGHKFNISAIGQLWLPSLQVASARGGTQNLHHPHQRWRPQG